MKEERSRRWQLTENNSELTLEDYASNLATIGAVQYVIVASEIGEKGTKHIHAFVVFMNAVRNTSIKDVFKRAHFEQCYGSNEDNVEYLKKQGVYIERGALRVPRKSEKDVASEVFALLAEGRTLKDIMLEYKAYCDYVVRHYRSLKDIEQDIKHFGTK